MQPKSATRPASTPAPLVRPQEVADAISVSRYTVLRWCREGRLRHVKLSGSVRIPREELDRIYEEGIQ